MAPVRPSPLAGAYRAFSLAEHLVTALRLGSFVRTPCNPPEVEAAAKRAAVPEGQSKD